MSDNDGCAGCAWVVVLALVAGFFWLRDLDRRQAASAAAEDSVARTRIALSQVDVEDVALRPSIGSFQLTGRIRNRSWLYRLTRLEIVVRILDCATPTQCETIGQETAIVLTDVPPQQVRALDEYVQFSNLPPRRGRPTFDYRIVSLSGTR